MKLAKTSLLYTEYVPGYISMLVDPLVAGVEGWSFWPIYMMMPAIMLHLSWLSQPACRKARPPGGETSQSPHSFAANLPMLCPVSDTSQALPP